MLCQYHMYPVWGSASSSSELGFPLLTRRMQIESAALIFFSKCGILRGRGKQPGSLFSIRGVQFPSFLSSKPTTNAPIPTPRCSSSNQPRWPGRHPSVSPEEESNSGLNYPSFFPVKNLWIRTDPLKQTLIHQCNGILLGNKRNKILIHAKNKQKNRPPPTSFY